jgi:hypothetical protein
LAATPEAQRLTEAHRLAQARLAAQTIQAMRTIWPLLDPTDLEGTAGRWLNGTRLVVDGQRRVSALLAANYVQTFKTLELGPSTAAAPLALAETAAPAAVTTSMLVTGPTAVRSALRRGVPVARAMDVAQARTAAAAMRHVLDGGRETITNTVAADRQARGWARSVSTNCCSFCAMLASRGPVYSNDSVSFHSHDACKCTAEPVYRDDAAWPAGSERFKQIWNESTSGLSGQDAANAFRRSLSAA